MRFNQFDYILDCDQFIIDDLGTELIMHLQIHSFMLFKRSLCGKNQL
jgi:hypothetical protein